MKRISNILFFMVIFLIGIGCVYAEKNPPAPITSTNAEAFNDNCSVCPPPGLAVDDKVLLLFVVALFFGLFKIYSFIFKKKRPA